MYTTESRLRVRYAETDQMGYVYYGNYATYYEISRTEAIRQLGLSYKELEEEEGVMLPVLENHSKYLQPARYDDLLRVVVCIPEKPKVRLTFTYKIYNQDEVLIHTGRTVLVFVDKVSGRPCRMPQRMEEKLDPYFTDERAG